MPTRRRHGTQRPAKVMEPTKGEGVDDAIFRVAWSLLCTGCATCRRVAADAVDMSSWYTFTPRSTPEPGEIGMQDWLSKPAGKDGRVTARAGQALLQRQAHQALGPQPVLQCMRAGAGAGRQAGRVLSQVRHQLRAAAQVRRRAGLVRDSVQGKLRRVRSGGPRPHGLPGRQVQGGGHLRAALGSFRRTEARPRRQAVCPLPGGVRQIQRREPHHHAAQRDRLLARAAERADPPDGQPAQAQESLHGPDLCQRPGRRVHRDHQRAEHPLLHVDGPARRPAPRSASRWP